MQSPDANAGARGESGRRPRGWIESKARAEKACPRRRRTSRFDKTAARFPRHGLYEIKG